MYTIRFNPVFDQWVLIGAPVPISVTLPASALLDIGRTKEFVAASYPRPVFHLDQPATVLPSSQSRLYHDVQPVGEYELMLSKLEVPLARWLPKHWEGWISLIQLRLLQLHHNPQLNHILFQFRTEAFHSIEGYQRVGDLLATSHPIQAKPSVLTQEFAQKIAEKEHLYKAHVGRYGFVYVPSAPTAEHEVWYVPAVSQRGFEQQTKEQRQELATCLAKVVAALHDQYPHEHPVLEIHTYLAGSGEEQWWLRITSNREHPAIVSTRAYPEILLRTLKLVFQEPN